MLAKLDEEIAELRAELAGRDASEDGAPAAPDRGRIAEELGDLLFTAANLARKLDVDPEGALAAANRKFRRRFEHVERGARRARPGARSGGLEEMDALWERGEAARR